MIQNFVSPNKISSIYLDKQKKIYVPKKLQESHNFIVIIIATFSGTKLFEIRNTQASFEYFLPKFGPRDSQKFWLAKYWLAKFQLAKILSKESLAWIIHRELKLDGAIGHFAEPL